MSTYKDMPIDREDKTRHTEFRWLIAAVLLLVVLQIVVTFRSPAIAKDGITFIGYAKLLVQDPRTTLRVQDQHPGYPAMVLAAHWVVAALSGQSGVGAWIAAARLVSALSGIMVVVLVWLLTRRVFNPRAADVVALLTAALPVLVQTCSDTLSDAPHLMLYLAATWLACEGLVRNDWRWLVAAAAASGLAFWVRPEGLGVSLVLIAVLLSSLLWRRDRPPLGKLFGQVAAVALATAVVTVPYVVLAGKLTSKKNPFVSEQNVSASHGQQQHTEGVLVDTQPGFSPAAGHDRPSVVLVFREGLIELARKLGKAMYVVLLIPLLAGNFAPGRPPRQIVPAVMVTVLAAAHAMLLLVLYHTAGYISHRHVMPIAMILMLSTATGTIYLADLLAKVAGQPHWRRRVVAGMIAVVIIAMIPRGIRPLHRNHHQLVEAARWVKQHARPGDTVLTTSCYVPFYAEMDGLVLGRWVSALPPEVVDSSGACPWQFLVLNVDPAQFNARSIGGADAHYEQVVDYAESCEKYGSTVLVFRANRPQIGSLR